MATVSISYSTYDPNNQANERILGTEHIDNIEEILVPLNDKNTPIFITKAFSGEVCKRWRVRFFLGIAPDHWGVWLTEKDVSKDIYLSEILTKRRISNSAGFVKKGAIVIVEFGHIYQTLNFQTGLTKSAMYPCNHQEGEMHKRRPAVVVKVDRRGVTVVPVTSKEPDAHEYNRAIFELETESIQYIKELDTGKRSFAVCEMIQTVSPTRILPPESRDHKGRDRTYRRDESFGRRLSRNDMKALEQGLLAAVGMYSLQEKLNRTIRNDQMQLAELEALRPEVETIREELVELRDKYRILSDLYQASSGHATREDVEQEVIEYIGLD
ncbi:TPA: type II toxin-antitoxin system PemK/MazF family toxin [Klebsiella quasipneumoniae subsp. similipneumoniae]|nr:type II toxin-antitoxin system PemK/MazF family toxin [Klebsiella pneumoniae]HCI6115578.1 type II toxin-antitoxin system PemK/MazF family toxin [Klebsiella quasipneumoniae subsp. similipneumoniae]HCI6117917.1 type II toxin-antitoxin system PemK/MazF family toxin [Klebsiella quasipneumoniae subsp. similipneumoniae]HCI6454452.1 type II toxin-antitoxin system PemK/MazF family toxin [Klebsiella quasipneumoniae subsp. similipneumoniae]HCI6464200.1 type II toxin-antitoxin system PemK/MazF family t